MSLFLTITGSEFQLTAPFGIIVLKSGADLQ